MFPLRAYIYRDGLARFGTEKYVQHAEWHDIRGAVHDVALLRYEMGDISNLFAHLTNSSINKFSDTYSSDKDVIGPGCKWSLKQLWQSVGASTPAAPTASNTAAGASSPPTCAPPAAGAGDASDASDAAVDRPPAGSSPQLSQRKVDRLWSRIVTLVNSTLCTYRGRARGL